MNTFDEVVIKKFLLKKSRSIRNKKRKQFMHGNYGYGTQLDRFFKEKDPKQTELLHKRIVFVTDYLNLKWTNNDFDDCVKLIKDSKLNVENAYYFLKKKDLLGKDSILVIMCGIHSVIRAETVDICRQSKCQNPLIKYSIIPGVTGEALIYKSLSFQKSILYNTPNDQVMFCDIIPININSIERVCKNDHKWKNVIHKDIYSSYMKAIEEYNLFVEQHCQMFGFKNFDLFKNSLKNHDSSTANIDNNLLFDNILKGIQDLRENRIKKDEHHQSAKEGDLTSSDEPPPKRLKSTDIKLPTKETPSIDMSTSSNEIPAKSLESITSSDKVPAKCLESITSSDKVPAKCLESITSSDNVLAKRLKSTDVKLPTKETPSIHKEDDFTSSDEPPPKRLKSTDIKMPMKETTSTDNLSGALITKDGLKAFDEVVIFMSESYATQPDRFPTEKVTVLFAKSKEFMDILSRILSESKLRSQRTLYLLHTDIYGIAHTAQYKGCVCSPSRLFVIEPKKENLEQCLDIIETLEKSFCSFVNKVNSQLNPGSAFCLLPPFPPTLIDVDCLSDHTPFHTLVLKKSEFKYFIATYKSITHFKTSFTKYSKTMISAFIAVFSQLGINAKAFETYYKKISRGNSHLTHVIYLDINRSDKNCFTKYRKWLNAVADLINDCVLHQYESEIVEPPLTNKKSIINPQHTVTSTTIIQNCLEKDAKIPTNITLKSKSNKTDISNHSKFHRKENIYAIAITRQQQNITTVTPQHCSENNSNLPTNFVSKTDILVNVEDCTPSPELVETPHAIGKEIANHHHNETPTINKQNFLENGSNIPTTITEPKSTRTDKIFDKANDVYVELYDHIVFISCGKKLFKRLRVDEEGNSNYISFISLNSCSEWNEVRKNLNSIESLTSSSNILFIICGSLNLFTKEFIHTSCSRMNCTEVLSYITSSTLSADSLIFHYHKVNHFISQIKTHFSKGSDVLLIPFTTLCADRKFYDHNQLHLLLGNYDSAYLVIGKKKRWNEAARQIKRFWKKEALFIDAEEKFKSVIPDLLSLSENMSFVHWVDLEKISMEFENEYITKCQTVLTKLLTIAKPSTNLKFLQSLELDSANLHSLGNDDNTSKIQVTVEPRVDKDFPKFVLDLTKVDKRNDNIPFEHIYIIGKAELSSLLDVASRKNVTMIQCEQSEVTENEIPTLLTKFGDLKSNSVCFLILDLLFFAEAEESLGCKKYECNTPLNVMNLDIAENADIMAVNSYLLSKIMDLIAFITKLSLHIPVIVMPIFPARLYCEDGFFTKHKRGHSINKSDSYIAQGTKEKWETFGSVAFTLWMNVMKSNNEKHFLAKDLAIFIKESYKCLTIEDDLGKYDSPCLDILKWKHIMEVFVQILLVNTNEQKKDCVPSITAPVTKGSRMIQDENNSQLVEKLELQAPTEVKLDQTKQISIDVQSSKLIPLSKTSTLQTVSLNDKAKENSNESSKNGKSDSLEKSDVLKNRIPTLMSGVDQNSQSSKIGEKSTTNAHSNHLLKVIQKSDTNKIIKNKCQIAEKLDLQTTVEIISEQTKWTKIAVQPSEINIELPKTSTLPTNQFSKKTGKSDSCISFEDGQKNEIPTLISGFVEKSNHSRKVDKNATAKTHSNRLLKVGEESDQLINENESEPSTKDVKEEKCVHNEVEKETIEKVIKSPKNVTQEYKVLTKDSNDSNSCYERAENSKQSLNETDELWNEIFLDQPEKLNEASIENKTLSTKEKDEIPQTEPVSTNESTSVESQNNDCLQPIPEHKVLNFYFIIWSPLPWAEEKIIKTFIAMKLKGFGHIYEDHCQVEIINGNMEDINNLLKKMDAGTRIYLFEEKEIFVFLYKTLKCDGSCKGKQEIDCYYYHDKIYKRRPPMKENSFKYNSVLCRFALSSLGCKKGDSCTSSHNRFEINFHPTLYQSSSCSDNHIGLCKGQPWCSNAHKYTPEMFYNSDWEDLVAFGPENSLQFIIGAIRGLNKTSNFRENEKKIIFISPSQKFLHIVKSVILSLMKESKIRVILVDDSPVNPDIYDVFLGTLENIANHNSNLITRKDVRALIVDDVMNLLNKFAIKLLLIYFIQKLKENSVINIVFVSENYNPKDADHLSAVLGIPLKHVIPEVKEESVRSKIKISIPLSTLKSIGEEFQQAESHRSRLESFVYSPGNTLREKSPNNTCEKSLAIKSRIEMPCPRSTSKYVGEELQQSESHKSCMESFLYSHSREKSLNKTKCKIPPTIKSSFSKSSKSSSLTFSEAKRSPVKSRVKIERKKESSEYRTRKSPHRKFKSRSPNKSYVECSEKRSLPKSHDISLFKSSEKRRRLNISHPESCKKRSLPQSRINKSLSKSPVQENRLNIGKQRSHSKDINRPKSKLQSVSSSCARMSTSQNIRLSSSDNLSIIDEEKFSVDGTITVLEQVNPILGMLGPAVAEIAMRARDFGVESSNTLKLFTDEENIELLKIVVDKLKSMLPSASPSDLPVFAKAATWVLNLLDYANKPPQPEVILNLKAIALASRNKSSSFTLNLIKTAFAYEGKRNPTRDEINEVFLQVCTLHFKMTLEEN